LTIVLDAIKTQDTGSKEMPKHTPTSRSKASDSTSSIDWLPTEDLLFDPENPRLIEHFGEEETSQADLLRILWQHMAVDELALSISASGYFDYEPLFVVPAGKKWYVIEGNRRLAAVRLLTDLAERTRLRATDLPTLSTHSKNRLSTLPVIKTTRKDAWQYLGFKHVNGPVKWDSYAKAQYVAQVHRDFAVPLEEIANQIGDKHQTVQRFYRALMVIEQAERAKVFSRANRHKSHFSFSHLYTGLDYEGIAEFVKLKDVSAESTTPVPNSRMKELGELLTWMYGDKGLEKPALVESQNPHLRNLDEVLKDPTATDSLRAGLPLNVALEVSYGDEQLFVSALHRAKESLQKARGTFSTGYKGERDSYALAESIFNIASDLLDDMDRKKPRRQRNSGAN